LLEVQEYQMKSGAEPRTSLIVRGAGLFDRVDYRLIETPEEKDSIYLMRYRAYLHGGLILSSDSQRVSDSYDEAPNAWTFGIYVDGELCSSLRLHVLTSEWRMSYATELFGDVLHPRLDQGEVFVDPARFVADPEKAQRFPELPYLTLRLAYLACEYFNADTGLALVRAEHQAFYRRIFLHETIAEPRAFPNVTKKVAHGVRFPGPPGTGDGPFPDHALQRFRAADAVPARSSCLPEFRYLHVRACLDRSEFLKPPDRNWPEIADRRQGFCQILRANRLLAAAPGPANRGLRPYPACLHRRATFTNH